MITEQRATLYRGAKGFCAYPNSRTAAGFYLNSAPFVRVQEEVAGVIGAAVRKALSGFRDGIPTPSRDSFSALAKPRLEAAGVGSATAFMRAARLISINKKEEIVVTPYRNDGITGPKKGFEAIISKAISLPPTADDTTLGEACLQALALCE